jgi:hypothetical protein
MPIDLDIIFLALLLSIWAILGLIPWLVLAVRRRGRGVLIALPLAIAGGIGGGVLVPAVGLRDVMALILSVGASLLGGLALSLVGLRLSRGRRTNPM